MKPIDDKPQNKKFKIKKEYVFIVIVFALVAVLFLSNSLLSKDLFSSSKNKSLDYATTIENKLVNLLSNVDGVGKVKVMVTVDGSASEVVLKEIEEKVENGIKTRTESVVLVGGKPYVLSTENPKINGVCVVCEGADVLGVQVKIIEILTTSLKLDANCVRIIKMK